MRLKINRYSNTAFFAFLYLVALLVFAPFESLYHYFPFVWQLMSLVSLILSYSVPFISAVIFFCKANRKKVDVFIWLIALYFATLLIATIVSEDGNLYGAITFILKLITFVILQASLLKHDPIAFVNITLAVLWSYVVINLVTIIMYPNGMYIGVMSDGSTNMWNWFLGYKNSFLPYYYYAAVVGCAKSIETKSRKFSIINFSMIVVMVISLIMVNATTSYVGMIILAFAYLFAGVLANRKFINSIVCLITNGFLLAFFVILDKIAPAVAFIITNFFKKDLTFSSRRAIWDNALYEIQSHFFIGHGYQSGTTITQAIGMQHTHNMYLWQLYRGGIVLLIFFIAIIYILLKKVEVSKNRELGRFFIVSFFLIMFMWQFEIFGDSLLIYSLITIVVCVNSFSALNEETKERCK